MISTLIERNHKMFSGGFEPPKGFSNFFQKNFRFKNKPADINIPGIGILHVCKKETKRKSNGDYSRELFLLEDTDGNRVAIIINRNEFKPTNRKNVPGYRDNEGETTAHVVYGEASTLGSIQFIQEKKDILEWADTLAFQEAKKMTANLERAGIKSKDDRNNIQLSGAHIAIIEDPQKPGSASMEKMQKTIGLLFGPNGLLNDIVIFPKVGQDDLMARIRLSGGRTLLHGPDQDIGYILSVKQFSLLQTKLYETARNMIGERMSEDNIRHLVKVFMVNVPNIIHRHKQLMEYNEVFTKPGVIAQYLEEELSSKLENFVKSI